jgi:hypothetical protein
MNSVHVSVDCVAAWQTRNAAIWNRLLKIATGHYRGVQPADNAHYLIVPPIQIVEGLKYPVFVEIAPSV